MVSPDIASLAGKRVFLTGDTGFKGAWMAHWLVQLGAEVYGYARPERTSDDLFAALDLRSRISHVDGELTDARGLLAAMRAAEPEVVIHMAAQALVRDSYVDPVETYSTNVMGSVQLLETLRQCSDSVRALVYVTSDKCYENREWIYGYRENDRLGGKDPYSASKAAAELVFSSYQQSFLNEIPHLGTATVRAGNVIGGGDWAKDRIVVDAVRALHRNEPIRLRNPGSTRPWQHVIEPVGGYLHLAARLLDDPLKYRGAWNFGPHNTSNKTVAELADVIVETWGAGQVVSAPETDAPAEAGLLLLNCDKSNLHLDWRPKWGFRESVHHTVDWYKRMWNGEAPAAITSEQIRVYEEATACNP